MRTITLCILALALAACGGGTSGRKAAETAPAKPTTFVFPEIPDLMTEPDQRLAYLVRHFWDEFDFADSTSLTNPDVGEQGFANFIALLPQALPGDAGAALDSLVKRAAPHPAALTFLLTNAEKYLYDPNSPYVNEELYATLVRPLLALPSVGYADKSRLTFRLDLIAKNRPGTPATDFPFLLYPREEPSSLHATPGREMLLVFYDPECEHCQATLQALVASEELAARIKDGLRVLAVYTEGNQEVWRETAPLLPHTWTVATDTACAVKDTPLYDLKAMPSLYLLDADKKVVLKDTSLPALLQRWEENGSIDN